MSSAADRQRILDKEFRQLAFHSLTFSDTRPSQLCDVTRCLLPPANQSVATPLGADSKYLSIVFLSPCIRRAWRFEDILYAVSWCKHYSPSTMEMCPIAKLDEYFSASALKSPILRRLPYFPNQKHWKSVKIFLLFSDWLPYFCKITRNTCMPDRKRLTKSNTVCTHEVFGKSAMKAGDFDYENIDYT